MNANAKISSMLKEAELYRKQGLLDETLHQYKKIKKILLRQENAKNKEALLKKIDSKIEVVQAELNAFLESKEIPEVSEDVRKIMRTMFSLNDPAVKGSSLLGEAIALAEFGQYDAALKAFERLLDFDHLRMDAAQKILVYSLEFKGEKETIQLVKHWESDHRFSIENRNFLVKHLQDLVKNAKTNQDPDESDPAEPESDLRDNDVLDITAVRIHLPKGPGEGRKVKLSVNFQHGTNLNVVVPRSQPEIAQALQAGDFIKEVRFYSPAAIFSGTIYVALTRQIHFGPQNGDTSINLKILSITDG